MWFLTQDTFWCRKVAEIFQKNKYVNRGDGGLKEDDSLVASMDLLFVKDAEGGESVGFSRVFYSPIRSGTD